jgi:hypothetical protein
MRNYAGKTYRYPQVEEPMSITSSSASSGVAKDGSSTGAARGRALRIPEPAALLE